jgi:serine/threonine protein kinase
MKNRSTFIGKHFGRYQVTAIIACGASGCVYLARHDMLTNRIVAIKVMHTAHLHSPQEQDRFFREAQILVTLSHPHILDIYDLGIDEDEGLPYLVMEYASNGSLRDLLDRQPQHLLPVAQSLSIITQVGEALHYAHQNGIVHRDLKPENILFNAKDEALLTDFSIAIVQNTTSIENAIDIMGTPPYMAPEQFDGRVSRRSDQYSLGCISYELFTGRKPFQAHNTGILMHMHKYENPIPLTKFNPLVPVTIEQAVLKAMAKRRINRYANVSHYIQALHTSSFSHASDTTIPDLSQMNKWQWLSEGIQLRKLQRYEAALEADEQALLLDFNFSPAHNNKGNSLYYLKRYEAAIVAYEQAIALDPNFALPYNNKANTLLDFKRYKEALSVFEQAIRLDPNYATAYYGKSYTLFNLMRYREALAACEQAIRLDPNFALAYHGMAILLIQFGRYPEALDALESAIQIDANQPVFHYIRGNILQKLGRIAEARQAYERGNQLEKH